jgi:hypothetical protein
MKMGELKRCKPLTTRNGLKVYKRLKKTTPKTAKRNSEWRTKVMARAKYLIQKYGHIVCEYSGEPIWVLSSVPNDLDEGWGHHIDGNRNHCVESNVYLCKYRYHRIIEDNNIQVKQEDFQGRKKLAIDDP